MDLHGSNPYTRRAFLRTGVTLASAALTVPWFLHRSASAMAQLGTGSRAGVPDDRVLVVLQLAGGNDGLNTVVPFGEREYHNARPRIAIGEREVLALDKGAGIGLHPAMGAFKDLYDEGLVGILQGVGYPNPNRSHFASMDIWHTADTSATGNGWLGRYFDNQCSGCPGHAGIAIGRATPLAMEGSTYRGVSFESEHLFRWSGAEHDETLREPYRDVTGAGVLPGTDPDSPAGFLMRTTLDAQIASDSITKALDAVPRTEYPRTNLGRQLAMVAAMIRAGVGTRVYYVSHGGFDTHAGQGGVNGQHANLLRQFADALKAFYSDLKAQGNDGRVLTMSFSEFGRRVGQNGSGGTDHGAAAPMFLMGPMVRPGLLGRHPSLTDLDEGDLKYRVDFRCIYASVLADWLKADAKEVLGRSYRKASVIRA